MQIQKIESRFGKASKNRLEKIAIGGIDGALAALETFYYSFNNKDIDVFRSIWLDNDLIQLNNPLGGILRGLAPVVNLYERIFNGDANVWVEFHDILLYAGDDFVAFAGRERGEFVSGGNKIDLDIRTTRLFMFDGKKWGQVHHHGSIDDPDLLKKYQLAVSK